MTKESTCKQCEKTCEKDKHLNQCEKNVKIEIFVKNIDNSNHFEETCNHFFLVNNFQNMKIKHKKASLVIFIVHLFQRTLVCQIDR